MNKQEFLTEDHAVIAGILNTNSIDDKTKLLAITELKHLEQSDNVYWIDKHADNVDHLFEWENSELGSTFWSKLQDDVFGYSRSC